MALLSITLAPYTLASLNVTSSSLEFFHFVVWTQGFRYRGTYLHVCEKASNRTYKWITGDYSLWLERREVSSRWIQDRQRAIQTATRKQFEPYPSLELWESL